MATEVFGSATARPVSWRFGGPCDYAAPTIGARSNHDRLHHYPGSVARPYPIGARFRQGARRSGGITAQPASAAVAAERTQWDKFQIACCWCEEHPELTECRQKQQIPASFGVRLNSYDRLRLLAPGPNVVPHRLHTSLDGNCIGEILGKGRSEPDDFRGRSGTTGRSSSPRAMA